MDTNAAMLGSYLTYHVFKSPDISIALFNSPRLIRIVRSTNFAIHDLVLTDCKPSFSVRILFVLHTTLPIIAPEFHLVLDTCSQGEVYNMAIR